jgi:hypothetical protein
MNAFGFSDSILESSKEPPNETLDQNNFSNIKLLKSIHDESFDVANEFFKEGFKKEEGDDDEVEGFVDNDDDKEEFDNDDLIEGMKSKKTKSKKTKSKKTKSKKTKSKKIAIKTKSKSKKSKGSTGKNQFDVIAWAVNKAKGTINDEQMIKTVLNSLFVTFLSFLIAHNWYSNFFTNQSYFRIETVLKSENALIKYFTKYIVGIVITIESFLMSTIPGYFNSLIDTAIFGKRSVFFIILMMSLSFVPYFMAQIMSIYGFLKSETIKLIAVIRNYNKSPVGLRNFIRDFISKIFSYIFLFKGNPMISGIIGLLFVSEYIKDLIPDFQFIVNSSIFYKIYLVLKFAIFYQPNVAFSSMILTFYFFYFSVLRLPKINGIGGIFREMSANNEHMNKEKIKFSFSESIEKIINFLVENVNQIILLFIIKQNFPNVLKMDSTILKIAFIALGIIAIIKILYSVLEKNGIGKEEKREIEKNIEIVSEEFEKSVAESNAKPPVSTSFDEFLLQNLYKPYNKI